MQDKIQEIADEIIAYSDGAFHIAWNEAYEDLTPEEQHEVAQIVYDNIAGCDGCGWNFMVESLEQHSDGQCYCWRCYEDVIDADEEETEE
jgi:formylmethanofuran dehydrogenase subunit E